MARRRLVTAPTGPGAVLGLVTLALSGSAWWLVVTSEPDDDLTVPFVLQIATFAGAAVTAALWRLRAQPTGGQDEDGRRERLPSPPRGLWLLPLGELTLFSLTLPVLSANNPGDPTVVGLAVRLHGGVGVDRHAGRARGRLARRPPRAGRPPAGPR